MATMGQVDYRTGAKERLKEAGVLLREELWAGSTYLAGRAVEGMLRAVIWASDAEYAQGKKVLETGHNLREMLRLVRALGTLRGRDPRLLDSITPHVEKVARLWANEMRFWPTAKVKQVWLALREIGGKRTMKQAALEHYNACSAVVKRCEALWQG